MFRILGSKMAFAALLSIIFLAGCESELETGYKPRHSTPLRQIVVRTTRLRLRPKRALPSSRISPKAAIHSTGQAIISRSVGIDPDPLE